MSLRQELLALDEQISAVNEQIQTLRWRRTSEGNRRQTGEKAHGDSGIEPGTSLAEAGDLWEEERRLPTAMRVALLRDELASALQRYMALQTMLRVGDNGCPR